MIGLFIAFWIAALVALAPLVKATRHRRVAQRLRPIAAPSLSLLGRAVHRWNHRSQTRQPVDDLADFVDHVARQCSSGHSLSKAFESAVAKFRCGARFHDASRALLNGATLSEALESRPDPATDDLILAWHMLASCSRHGGNITEPLDRAAATLRSRQAMRHERFAQSAQARMSAQVLTVTPVAFAGYTAITTPSVRAFLVGPIGVACIAIGLVLNLVGWRWMRRIVRLA